VREFYKTLGAAAGFAILAACTSGQSGIEPPSTAVNVQNTTALQFRVGTARVGASTFLNTLVTYRQTNGLAGTLVNTPTITGPAGFVVPPAAAAGTDAGTNHISATPPTQPGTPAVATTFNQSGGAYEYGFAPANANTGGGANYPTNLTLGNLTNTAFGCNFCGLISPNGAILHAYTQPIYLGAGARFPFLLGPPAVPDFHDGTFPTGFLGYDSGFVMFAATPVVGSYALHLTVPSATMGVNSAVFDVSATLASAAPLGAQATPVITPTAGGGASFTVPAGGAGVTNQVLYVVGINAGTPTFYAFGVPAAGATVTLSATSGPKTPTGPTPPFPSGSDVFAYTVGADYDILAGAPPMNTQPTPALPAQADVTLSSAAHAAIP
jgi:hypothetical protein